MQLLKWSLKKSSLTAKESIEITVPLDKMRVNCLFLTNKNWQGTVACYLDSIDNYPQFSLLRILKMYCGYLPKITSKNSFDLGF